MSLEKVEYLGNGIDYTQPTQQVLKEVCQQLHDTMSLLKRVNNECIALRVELEHLKKTLRVH